MKTILFITALLACSLTSNAQIKIENPQKINTHLRYTGDNVKFGTRALAENMYYYRPCGVFYSGFNESLYNPQFSYMPADVTITYKADYTAGMPLWIYSTGERDKNGEFVETRFEGNELALNLPKGIYFTPVLLNGENQLDMYAPCDTMLVGGEVLHGETDFEGQHVSNDGYASNYIPVGMLQSVIDMFSTANEVSDENASVQIFEEEKTVHTLGFAESFKSVAHMYVKGFNSIVLTNEVIDETNISQIKPSFGYYDEAANWTEIAGSDAFDHKIVEVMSPEYGLGFYYLDFTLKGDVIDVEPNKTLFVKLNSDDFALSPAFDCQPRSKTAEDDNINDVVTAFADVELDGVRTPLRMGLGFDDGAGGKLYLNSWMIGIDMSYDSDTYTSIKDIEADKNKTSDVYDITGVKVAENGNTDNLPSGVYVTGGKKIIKR